MAKPISEGDTVLCRLYNTPEGKFYGENWLGTVEKIVTVPLNFGKSEKRYSVTRGGLPPLWLHRKEIKRRL